MNCKICDQPTHIIGSGDMLGHSPTEFMQCTRCSFVQTGPAVWLNEAYRSAITSSDLGLVKRNLTFANVCSVLIPILFPTSHRFVDYGGGYGLFVRLMRDAGFDFFRYDPICQNLFAQGLDVELPAVPAFDLVTAFEVFEHLIDPLHEITTMLKFGYSIFFSTELIAATAPSPQVWPYYGLDHGQHIAFYSMQTLQVIAEKFGLRLYTNGQSIHLLTDKNISHRCFRMLLHQRVASILRPVVRRPSLLDTDVKSVLASWQATR